MEIIICNHPMKEGVQEEAFNSAIVLSLPSKLWAFFFSLEYTTSSIVESSSRQLYFWRLPNSPLQQAKRSLTRRGMTHAKTIKPKIEFYNALRNGVKDGKPFFHFSYTNSTNQPQWYAAFLSYPKWWSYLKRPTKWRKPLSKGPYSAKYTSKGKECYHGDQDIIEWANLKPLSLGGDLIKLVYTILFRFEWSIVDRITK
jgi:hypothetical protein